MVAITTTFLECKSANSITEVFKTSFNGIDLSEVELAGISISAEDIKGATINIFQTADLLYLLGVKLKE